MLAQETRKASANTELWSLRITSAGDFRPLRAARGVAPTLRDPICCSTCALVRKVLSRNSKNSASKLPSVIPTKPPAPASVAAFGDVDVAVGLARETMLELEVSS